MKTKILGLVAVAAISLSTAAMTGSAQARGGYPGMGHDETSRKHGVTEYHYQKICERLYFNWKHLGNLKARELFLRWNCYKYVHSGAIRN